MKYCCYLLLLLLTCAQVSAQKQRQWLLRTAAGASFQEGNFDDNVGYTLKASGEYFIANQFSAGLSISYNKFFSNFSTPLFPGISKKKDFLPIMATISYYPTSRLYICTGGGLVHYNAYYNYSPVNDPALILAGGYFFNKQKKNFSVEIAYTTLQNFFKYGYVSTTLSYCFWSKKK